MSSCFSLNSPNASERDALASSHRHFRPIAGFICFLFCLLSYPLANMILVYVSIYHSMCIISTHDMFPVTFFKPVVLLTSCLYFVSVPSFVGHLNCGFITQV
uniref:Uncharacterized protein n=1 Tax=Parascaris univalens TaxID=6257 RepID=A0A914ZSF5_PARUN